MNNWVGRQKVFTTGLATLAAIILAYFIWPLLGRRFSWLPPIDSGQVLAVIAIVFAVMQFLDSRSVETTLWHQTVKLAGQASDLKGIADSLYTRFIGKFPDNIKEICELIGQVDANQSLKVIVDYPRYGEYSAPALCDRYIQQLCKIREQGSSVQIICYDSTLAAKELLGQLPDGEGQVRDQQLWEAYFKSYSGITPPETFSEFRKILLDHDAAQIRELSSRGIQWRFHSEPAAFFLWIKDDREAIFTFNNVGFNDVGLTFQTRDKALVEVFVDLFERRWKNADLSYDEATPLTTDPLPGVDTETVKA